MENALMDGENTKSVFTIQSLLEMGAQVHVMAGCVDVFFKRTQEQTLQGTELVCKTKASLYQGGMKANKKNAKGKNRKRQNYTESRL